MGMGMGMDKGKHITSTATTQGTGVLTDIWTAAAANSRGGPGPAETIINDDGLTWPTLSFEVLSISQV